MQLQMEKLYKDLSEYYAFDPSKYTMEEFFADIKTFKDAFQNAHNENVRVREELEKSEDCRRPANSPSGSNRSASSVSSQWWTWMRRRRRRV